MARSFAISHSSSSRPAGQPASNFRALTPAPHSTAGRRIQQVNPVASRVEEVLEVCSATTKAGSSCKARPVVGTGLCVFHGGGKTGGL